MAPFDFPPLSRRYAQDEPGRGLTTVRPERSEAESKGAVSYNGNSQYLLH